MTSVAVVATKGAPGATTFALALGAAWPADRPVALVECDPSGSDIAMRFSSSVDRRPGTASLVLALRREPVSGSSGAPPILAHAQKLPGGLDVVVGPIGGDAAHAVDEELSSVDLLGTASSLDLVLDCGRLIPRAAGQERLLGDSDHAVLLTRSDALSLVNSAWAVQRIWEVRGHDARTSLVTVGDGPFDPRQMASALGVDLLGVLPIDPSAADMVCGRPGRPRALARSALIAVAARLARALSSDDTDEPNGRGSEAELSGEVVLEEAPEVVPEVVPDVVPEACRDAS